MGGRDRLAQQRVRRCTGVASDATAAVTFIRGRSTIHEVHLNEVTHRFSKPVDASGNVAWGFAVTAPAAPATITLSGAGLSVDDDGGTDGDDDDSTTRSVTVVDNLARFVEDGTGLAGTGGMVPLLAGAGSISFPSADVSALAPLVIYLEAGTFDVAAVRGVSLTNGLELHIEL